MTFYDREEELDALASAFESPGPDVFVVYNCTDLRKPSSL